MQLRPLHPEVPLAPRYPHKSRNSRVHANRRVAHDFLPVFPTNNSYPWSPFPPRRARPGPGPHIPQLQRWDNLSIGRKSCDTPIVARKLTLERHAVVKSRVDISGSCRRRGRQSCHQSGTKSPCACPHSLHPSCPPSVEGLVSNGFRGYFHFLSLSFIHFVGGLELRV